MIQLFDTARGQVRPLETREENRVSMYVCGPTVYGPPHLGHGRFSLVFDVLRRYLEWSGFDVVYVSNITDIDDNIIDRAEREQRPWQDVVNECEDLWYEAMDAIGVKRPDHDPHATAYVEEMVALLEELVAAGAAYETDDGLYFSPDKVDDYGLLARQSLESLQSGARIEVDSAKRSPIDFALWKKSKPGEPAWTSPWGDGRPGWHTECVVMSLDLLGERFDIHGGGQDLAFPHHENERAQSMALSRPFANHWVHNGFVEVDGEKMSKSLNNFTNLMDLVNKSDPRAYRLLVLQAHYRSPVTVDANSIDQAVASLDRLDTFARRTAHLLSDEELQAAAALRQQHLASSGAAGSEHTDHDDAVGGFSSVDFDPSQFLNHIDAFSTAMDNDMDTPEVMSQVFELVRAANVALDNGDEATARLNAVVVAEISAAVGLALHATGEDIPDDIAALAKARFEARAEKDWAAADAARDQLQAAGWIVEDTNEATLVRRA